MKVYAAAGFSTAVILSGGSAAAEGPPMDYPPPAFAPPTTGSSALDAGSSLLNDFACRLHSMSAMGSCRYY